MDTGSAFPYFAVLFAIFLVGVTSLGASKQALDRLDWSEAMRGLCSLAMLLIALLCAVGFVLWIGRIWDWL